MLPEGGMSIEGFLKAAAEMGLEGVEILARHFPRFTADTARYYRQVADSLGIRIEAYALENDYAFPEERVRKGEVDNTYFWIRMAACAGVPYLKIFTGDTDSRVDYNTQRSWVLECLKDVSAYAKAYNVTILVENHSPICFDYPALKQLVEDVDHPSCRICPDVYNFSKYKGEPVVFEAAEALLPLSPFSHLQFYEMDETGRELHMDMEKLISIYKKHDYDGFLMLEWEGESDPFPATMLQMEYIRSLL